MVLYFWSFSFLESSIIKPSEVETNHFSDQPLKNEIIKVKYGKPMWEKIVYTKTDELYIEWQRITTSGTTNDNEWQRVTTRGTTNATSFWKHVKQNICRSSYMSSSIKKLLLKISQYSQEDTWRPVEIVISRPILKNICERLLLHLFLMKTRDAFAIAKIFLK